MLIFAIMFTNMSTRAFDQSTKSSFQVICFFGGVRVNRQIQTLFLNIANDFCLAKGRRLEILGPRNSWTKKE
jgi:hypothetical protein